jgi:hypothetical protein
MTRKKVGELTKVIHKRLQVAIDAVLLEMLALGDQRSGDLPLVTPLFHIQTIYREVNEFVDL